jgi:hypothetical protein
MASLVEKIARRLFHERRKVWKILFAVAAIFDFLKCWPVFLEGWMGAVRSNKGVSSGLPSFWPQQRDLDDGDTCSTYSSAFYTILGKCLYTLDWTGPLFCLLCIVEAVLRAQEARENLLEMAALDNFEKKLAKLYSSARNFQTVQDEDTMYDDGDILARNTLRFWTPVIATLSLWAVLLPWRSMLDKGCDADADTALATYWISQFLEQSAKGATYAIDELVDWAWHLALPFSFWELHKIIQRIQTLLRWVRYFRFAGPMMRMLLKLNDQLMEFLKTSKQAWKANAEKAKRIIHRSMLFADIAKIESQNRRSYGLSKIPSKTVLKMASEEASEVGNLIKEKRQKGKKLNRELATLKEQVLRSSKVFPTSELYDRLIDLSQEFTTTLGSTLWSANLISPRTRFSVSWRIIVTCALVSELCRISTAVQMYGRPNVSYTTIMMSALGCATNRGGNILTATGRFTRKVVRHILKLPQEQLLSTCTKSSIASHSMANLLLKMSGVFEMTIDLVCFLDIYVWFFTGELDLDGRVIPKPFFYRCILPGTLVQVLDHPTVPDVLPNLLYYCVTAASAVGYSRLIRWMVAVVPTINVFLVDPIKKFLFRPMEQDEWLRYTESLAVFPAISGADIRYTMTMSHPNLANFDEADEDLPKMRRRSSMNIMPSTLEHRGSDRRRSSAFMVTEDRSNSFLPSVGELRRRESSSAGLNIESHDVPMDDESMHFNDLMTH